MSRGLWPGGICAVVACLLALLPARPASAQDVRSGVEQLAAQITKEAPGGKQLRIAVADFPDLKGVTSDLGRYIASRLTTRLAQSPKFFVIERQRLGQVLAELKFGMSDLVDPNKAKQLGRMAGVEAIIVGTVADVGNQFDFDARMIDIETNRLLLGATVAIAKDPAVDDMNKRGRQEMSLPTGTTGEGQPRRSSTPSLKAISDSGFTLEPSPCRRAGGEVLCVVTFINGGDATRQIYLNTRSSNDQSRMLDIRGNQYDITRIVIGPRSADSYLGENFPPGLPIRIGFVAKNVPDDVITVTLSLGVGGQLNRVLILRDVPISR